MAETAEVAEIADRARVARLETKRLAKQLRTTVRALAELDRVCEAYGITLEVEPEQE